MFIQNINFELLLACVVCLCSSFEDAVTKDVIVVGGGIAGLAAARRLINHPTGQYRVTVVEARKERYGGRIWTDRQGIKGARGLEADLGAMWINSKVQDNPILKLVQSAEMDMRTAGLLQLHVPEQNKTYTGDDAKKIFSEVFSVMQDGVDRVKKSGVDQPLRQTMEEELSQYKSHGDQSVLNAIVRSHHAAIISDHSTLHFDPVKEFGWDTTLPDGFDNVADIIAGGLNQEAVVPVELNKPIRQIKIDDKRKKVLVRARDLTQLEADHVIIALPLGVLQSKDSVIFEPPLPQEWRKALNKIGIRKSNKVIVKFENVFWPKDVGVFTMATENRKEWGFLQTWVNVDKIIGGGSFLMGMAHGEAAEKLEKMKDKELKTKILENLVHFFGKEALQQNITMLLRSEWQKDKFTQGAGSYTRVGISASVWETLKTPVCPYIYFAGGDIDNEYGLGATHGAYRTGVRAAEQIISKACDKLQKEKKEETPKGKKDTDSKSNKEKKDEL